MSLLRPLLRTSKCSPSSRTICLIGLSVALLSGCAAQYPRGQAPTDGYVLNQDSATPITNANLNGFLEQAPIGGAINLAESPWGQGVDVIADEIYLAASGRECRRLEVTGGEQTQQSALACRTESGWVNQRVVTESISRTQ